MQIIIHIYVGRILSKQNKTKQNYFLTDNKLIAINSETTFIAAGLLTFIKQIKLLEYFSPN